MKLLAINSSEKQAEISLLNKNTKIVHKMDATKSHSEFLLQEIENLLKNNNLTIQDIDFLSVNIGPGSFTGIRIGISFVKAFIMALNQKAVCVSNFDIISYNIINKPENYYVVLNSNNEDIYFCKFTNNKKEYGFINTKDLINISKNQNLNIYCNEHDFQDINEFIKVKINEESFLNISIQKVEDKDFSTITEINPLYIKKSQAEQQLQDKILSSLVISQNVNLLDLEKLEKLCFEEDYYSKNLLENDIKLENRKQYFAYYNNELIGYINFEVVLDEITLLKICVLKEFRNFNIASKLMEKMLEYKKENNINKIFLEVDSKNLPAIKLYEKFNFKQENIRKNYYKNGDDALILVLN